MWPWQRGSRAEHATAVIPRRAPEWPSVPAIQRVVSPLHPVAPRDAFAASLTSWRDPRFLAPLGHVVSSDAPSGVIHRLVEPAGVPDGRADGPSLPLAARPPAPRRAGGVVQRLLAAFGGDDPQPAVSAMQPSEATSGDVASGDVAPVDAAPPLLPPPASMATPVSAAPALLPVPVRPVQRAVSLTTAPPPDLPPLVLPAVPGPRVEVEPAVTAAVEPAEAPTLGAEPDPGTTRPDPGDGDGPGDAAPTGAVPLPVAEMSALGTVQRSSAAGVEPLRTSESTPHADERPVRPTGDHPSHGQPPLAPLVGEQRPAAVQRDVDTGSSTPPPVPAPAAPTPPSTPAVSSRNPGPVPPVGTHAPSRRLGLGTPIDPGTLQCSTAAPPSPPPVPASPPLVPVAPPGPAAPPVPAPPAGTEQEPALLTEPDHQGGTPREESVAPLLGAPEPGTPPLGGDSPPAELPPVQRSGATDLAGDPAPPPLPTAAHPVAPLVGQPPTTQRTSTSGDGPRGSHDVPPPQAAPPVVGVGTSPAVQRLGEGSGPRSSGDGPAEVGSSGAAAVAPLTGSAPPLAGRDLDTGALPVPQKGTGAEVTDGGLPLPGAAPPVVGTRTSPAVQRLGEGSSPRSSGDGPAEVGSSGAAAVAPLTGSAPPLAGCDLDTGALPVPQEGAAMEFTDGGLPLPGAASPAVQRLGEGSSPRSSGDGPAEVGSSGAAAVAPLTGSAPPLAGRDLDTGVVPQEVAGVEVTDGAMPLRATRGVVAPDGGNGSPDPPPVPLVVARLVGDRTPQPTIRSTPSPPAGAAGVLDAAVMPSAGYPRAPAPAPLATPPAPPPVAVVPAAPVIQTVTAEPPVVQTEQVVPQPDVPPVEEPAAAPDTAAPTTSATPAVAPGAAATPDELVKKLFDPLLRRLKNELRLDRERRGMLTDLRH